MSMMEYFEAGYQVVVGSMFGEMVMEDAEMVECYAEDVYFEGADDEMMVVHFYDSGDYDE